jgi:UDP-glucose 4-epimerase
MQSKVLITGGLGYIGSHTVLNFLQHTENGVVVVDNFSNSHLVTLSHLEHLTGQKIPFYQADVGDYEKMHDIFRTESIDAVIHFAAAKSVSDSMQHPDFYYQNNVAALMVLLKAMRDCAVQKMIFSSSATVYASSNQFPVSEEGQLGYLNPYGQTKLIGEDILIREHQQSGLKLNILRYFNPIGNEPTGHLGDSLASTATNIIPMILKALHQHQEFFIFGQDYPTKDGSPVRDYIHVSDLAEAHRLSYKCLDKELGYQIFNVGLGVGVTAAELIATFNAVNQLHIPVQYKERRVGDLAICYANANKIKDRLAWQPRYHLSDMCRDAYSYFKRTTK